MLVLVAAVVGEAQLVLGLIVLVALIALLAAMILAPMTSETPMTAAVATMTRTVYSPLVEPAP